MATTQQTDLIDIIDENEEVFATIEAEADDPVVAEKYGEKPLELLELDRERGGQA